MGVVSVSRSLVALVVVALSVVLASPASAGEGYLHLRAHASVAGLDGAQSARLYVYDANGMPVAVGGLGGQFEAGDYVPVESGWYFVAVGRHRAAANAVRMYVEEGHVTVVPSGWVFVQTPALEEQPRSGCNQWNASLNAFVDEADGSRALTMSNRGSGVRRYGAIQLLAGEQRVFFNELPATIEVREDTLIELPTGYQDPVYGERPQLSTGNGDDTAALRLSLCADGAVQVPAGEYFASGAVTMDVYPYERREWNAVTIEASDVDAPDELRAERLRYPRYEGLGSVPEALTPAEQQSLSSGSGLRLGPIGR